MNRSSILLLKPFCSVDERYNDIYIYIIIIYIYIYIYIYMYMYMYNVYVYMYKIIYYII